MNKLTMPALNKTTAPTLAATIAGAIVSIAAIFGFVIPQDVSAAAVSLALFVIAGIAHWQSHQAPKPQAVPPPAPAQGDGPQRG